MRTLTTIREIGRGGFGVVEEVRDDAGNLFARKTFDPASIHAAFHDKLRKRFKREVITQQELGGKEILPVLEHDLDCAMPWFIMPLAEKTYSEKIAEDRAKGSVEIDPLADILNGIQRLHDLGYVHRDLNPNNILFHEGVWKLSDLGAVLPPTGQTVTLTEDTIIYTERYCAPEQRQDFHAAQPPADIYSFGCILHDLFGIYNRTPYARHSAPGAIGVIIEKCTEANPNKRPKVGKLRGLVLDTLLEEGGYCKVEDAKAEEWLKKLDSIDTWSPETYDEFARFFAQLDSDERLPGHESDWVYSISTPFLTRLSAEALEKILARRDGISAAIVERYCEWAKKTQFLFNFADNICGRLVIIFDKGTPSDTAAAFAALVSLGHSHNRWYVMKQMAARVKPDAITPELGKRLAIELKTEDMEGAFRRCLSEIDVAKEDVAHDLAKLV